MVVINTVANIFQVNANKLRRLFCTVDLQELLDSYEEQERLCYGSGSEMKSKIPWVVVMSLTVFPNTQKKKKLNGNSAVCALVIAEYQFSVVNIFLGPESGKISGWRRYITFRRSTIANGSSCEARNPSGFSQCWWLTWQCSTLFNNMGSINRKSEFRKPENLNKPIVKCERFNVAELSLLKEFLGNNCAHVITTAEAVTVCQQMQSDYFRTVQCSLCLSCWAKGIVCWTFGIC